MTVVLANGAWRDRPRYLREVERHGGGIAEGQDQAGALALRRADGAKDVGRVGALIARRPWAGPPPGPTARDLVLLADPGFILEPDLYLCARGLAARDLRHEAGEVFLNASAACSLWA